MKGSKQGRKPNGTTGNTAQRSRLVALDRQRLIELRIAGEELRDMIDEDNLVEALRHSEAMLAERKRELEAINNLILSVGASLDLGAILDTVSEVMQRQFGVPAGAVLLYKEPG